MFLRAARSAASGAAIRRASTRSRNWRINLKKCIGEKECGLCLKECPESAIYVMPSDGKVRINWDLCTNCGKCVPVCPPNALYLFGQEMTVDQVLDEVEQDGSLLSRIRRRASR